MSRKVTIATLGPTPPQVEAGRSPEALVEQMIAYWRGWFERVTPDRPDLIVVPEACDRFSGMSDAARAEYYRARGGRVRDFFAATAREHRCYVVYSAAVQLADQSWRNASLVLDRNGQLAGEYHKNHLVIEENTQYAMCYGRQASMVECDFGRVGLAICFDLNFEELRQQYVQARPDLLVFPSMYHGGLMQGYWAYSCRCHFVAAVCGLPCQIRNPLGEVLYSSSNYLPYVVGEVNLDCCLAHLDHNWERLRAMKAEYGRGVEIHDPGLVGAVLITSHSEQKSALEMARAFEVELLDDYFARSLAHRHAPGHMEAPDSD